MSEKEDLYDEFGNILNSMSSDSEQEDSFEIEQEEEIDEKTVKTEKTEKKELIEEDRPILYEEKEYYKNFSDIYKKSEILIQEEDTQDFSEPLIKPPSKQNYYKEYIFEKKNFSEEFFKDLLSNDKNFRNIAIVGNYHSGKTKFLDLLINSEKNFKIKNSKKNHSDFLIREKEKKMTLVSKPNAILLEDENEKTFFFNFLDNPGHSDFFDDVKNSLDIVDSVFLIIDCIEGITNYTKKIIKEIKLRKLNVFIVFNKIDRFIVELRLPIKETFLKLFLLVQDLNEFFDYSPIDDNFFFASTRYNIFFNLKFFVDNFKGFGKCGIDLRKFFWGDMFFDSHQRRFFKKNNKEKNLKRTFVEFVLEPIYKIFTNCISKEKNELNLFLKNFDLKINQKLLETLDLKNLLRLIFSEILLKINSLVTTIIKKTKTPEEGNQIILKRLYKENYNQILEKENCTILYINKFYPNIPLLGDIPYFYHAFARVLKGEISEKTNIYLFSENEEKEITINKLYIKKISNLNINIKKAYPGNLVLIENIGLEFIEKGILTNLEEEIIFQNFNYKHNSNVKLGIEPLRPSELPILQKGLKGLNLFFAGLEVKIEETGEHLILGRGEMILDIVMDFLRNYFCKIEIRVSEPSCVFFESCLQTSKIFSRVNSLNKKNTFEFLCEPLEEDLSKNFKNIFFKSGKERKDYLRYDIKMDLYSVNNLWTINTLEEHPVFFFDDTLKSKTEKEKILPKKKNNNFWF